MVSGRKKKDLGILVEAPIDTRSKIVSAGRVDSRHRPKQVSWRLPAQQIEWLERHVNGNINYVVSKILEKGIAELNERLYQGGFDIDDL